MKIKRIRLLAPDYASRKDDASASASHARMAVIEVEAESGAIGRAPIRSEVAQLAQSAAVTLLVGADGRATAALWSEMHDAARRDNYALLPAECIAALDIALWDLRATAHGVPLFREIGAENCGVPVMQVISAPATVSAARQAGKMFATRWVSSGVFMMALELTDEPAVNEAAVRSVARSMKELGGRGVLGVRLPGAVSPKEVVRQIGLLERIADIAFVEVDAYGAVPESLRVISDGLSAAVCNAPTLATASDFHPFLSRRALDIVQIDPRLSGITGSLALSDAAYAFELPVMLPATVDHFGVHLASAMPYVMSVGASDVSFGPVGGRARAREGVGAGWRFNLSQVTTAGVVS